MTEFKTVAAVDKTAKAPMTIPILTPKEVALYGLERYERSLGQRLIHAAFHATLHAAGKTHYRPRHVVIRLVGAHGVGKTAVVEEYARREGLGYVKLDSAVTDIAEIFGLKDVIEGRTVTALPDWWPPDGTYGVINVDDMCRAQPHVGQGLMQFIMERQFNGVHLPDGWMIAITDNPDTGDYSVNSLDPAQLSRMISVPFNPTEETEFEQLVVQEVHDDMKNFWMAYPELIQPTVVDLPPLDEYKSPRMRMLFNRLYPYLKFDPALLDYVGSAVFGSNFVQTLRAYTSSEQPIRPDDIFNDVPYGERIERWLSEGRQDLLNLSVKRLLQELKLRDRLSISEFPKVAAFLKRVPVDMGAMIVHEATKEGSSLNLKFGSMMPRDPELMTRYSAYLGGVNKELNQKPQQAP